MLYEFDNAEIHNLKTFLDRVEIKGFQEIQAMNEILYNLNKPVIKEEECNNGTTETT